jgi:hypothetical protein
MRSGSWSARSLAWFLPVDHGDDCIANCTWREPCRFPLKRGLALQYEQEVSACVCTLKYGTGPLKRVLSAEATGFLENPEEPMKQVLPRA